MQLERTNFASQGCLSPKNPWLGGRKLHQSRDIPPQSKEYEGNGRIFLFYVHSCLSANVFLSMGTGSDTSMPVLWGEIHS